MTDLQRPNTQQANSGNMSGVTNEFLANWLRNEVDGMVPARVVSYDDTTNRAVLHPIVMMGGTDGSKIARADVHNIPVFRFGGGGMFMRFPLKAGDLGWLAANDNDISLIMQGGGAEDWPNTTRQCKFSDAMFFPDTFKAWVIAGANAENAVWQTEDGQTCIALGVNGVKISKGATTLNMTAEGIAMTGPPGGLTYNTKNVGDTHTHGGVTTGSGTSGVPT
jgi:hypothetical protein